MSVESLSNTLTPKRALGLAVMAGLSTLTCACGGKVPSPSYYTLRVLAPPPPAPASSDPKTSFTLGVERFTAIHMLRDDRIIYYQSPTELNYYEYHRWSADPGTLFGHLVARALDDMGVFSQVRVFPLHEPVDYLLRGRMLNFEEVDYESGTKARVGLELTLVRTRDHRMEWSATRQVERSVQGSGVPGVVNALNAASDELLRQVLPGLVEQVEQDFKESQAQPKETPAPAKEGPAAPKSN